MDYNGPYNNWPNTYNYPTQQPGNMMPVLQPALSGYLPFPAPSPYSMISNGMNNNMQAPTMMTPSEMELTQTGMGSSRRRLRTIFTLEAVEYLEAEMKINSYPDYRRRCYYAHKLKTTEDRIQVWFQNRRSRNKLKMLNKRAPSAATQTSDDKFMSEDEVSTDSITADSSHNSSSSKQATNNLGTFDGQHTEQSKSTQQCTAEDEANTGLDSLIVDDPARRAMNVNPLDHFSVGFTSCSPTTNTGNADFNSPALPESQVQLTRKRIGSPPINCMVSPAACNLSQPKPAASNVFQFPPLTLDLPPAVKLQKRKPSNLQVNSPMIPQLDTPRFYSGLSPYVNMPFTPPMINTPRPVVTKLNDATAGDFLDRTQ